GNPDVARAGAIRQRRRKARYRPVRGGGRGATFLAAHARHPQALPAVPPQNVGPTPPAPTQAVTSPAKPDAEALHAATPMPAAAQAKAEQAAPITTPAVTAPERAPA